MTTDKDGGAGANQQVEADNSASAEALNDASQPRKRSSWIRNTAADANRALAPTVKATGARLGDWLATVGWGKFFVVAILLLILAAIADNVFYDSQPTVTVRRGVPDPRFWSYWSPSASRIPAQGAADARPPCSTIRV